MTSVLQACMFPLLSSNRSLNKRRLRINCPSNNGLPCQFKLLLYESSLDALDISTNWDYVYIYGD